MGSEMCIRDSVTTQPTVEDGSKLGNSQHREHGLQNTSTASGLGQCLSSYSTPQQVDAHCRLVHRVYGLGKPRCTAAHDIVPFHSLCGDDPTTAELFSSHGFRPINSC